MYIFVLCEMYFLYIDNIDFFFTIMESKLFSLCTGQLNQVNLV